MRCIPPGWIAKEYRWPKVMWALFVIEIPLAVAMLTLFGVAQPNTYRTKLWQNGADQGFNSDPSMILYAMYNYKYLPTPLIWSQYLTDFNVVVSILGTFIWLTKVVLYIMHGFIPLVSVLTHAGLIAVYGVSIHNQSSPDMSDPAHPSPGLPWYLSKGCGYATQANYSACMQARASFGISIVLLMVYVCYFVYSAINLKPTAEEALKRKNAYEMSKIETYRPDTMSRDEQREYNRQLFLNLPKTPATPFHNMLSPTTPRTRAFNSLNGGASKEEKKPMVNVTVSKAGPSRKLPFREHYSPENSP